MVVQRIAATTAVVVIGSLLATSVDSQTLTVYASEAEFLTNAPIVSTENFDSYDTPTFIDNWVVQIDDVIYEISSRGDHDCAVISGDHCWYMTGRRSDGQPPVTSPNMFGSDAIGEFGTGDGWDIIGFGENRGVNALGFYFLSVISYDWIVEHLLPNFFGWEMAVHECNGTVTLLDVPPVTAATATYFGFTSEGGICQVHIAAQGPPTNIGYSTVNWAYDSVSRSEITSVFQTVTFAVRPRKINPRSQGRMRVDVLSDGIFDPIQIDVSTVRFGPTNAEMIRYKYKDINKDGLTDLRLWFRTRDTGIDCRDKEATLSAQTFGGVPVVGTEAIRTVRCK